MTPYSYAKNKDVYFIYKQLLKEYIVRYLYKGVEGEKKAKKQSMYVYIQTIKRKLWMVKCVRAGGKLF